MKIYVAHNYGRRRGLSLADCERNVEKSIIIGAKLIKMGHNPFIPNLYHYVHKLMGKETLAEEQWHELVSSWLPFCDAILIASKPKDSNSGVRQELEYANLLCLRVYNSIEEIPDMSI